MRQLTYNLILALAAVNLVCPVSLSAADVAAEDVMARVLLDKSAGADIKLDNVKVLLASDAGCGRLAEILAGPNNNETRAIICQALSQYNPGGLITAGKVYPKVFVDPLFNCLYSGDEVLSDRAADALAVCFPDTILGRLTEKAVSSEYQVSQRLAAMSAMERISSKESLLNLAALIQDDVPEVRQRAISAICHRLVISPDKFDAKRFIEVELPNLRGMSNVDFLVFQARKLALDNKQLGLKVDVAQKDVTYWRTKYLSAETDRFNSMTPDNKLIMLRTRLDISQDTPIRQWAAGQLVLWGNTAPARDSVVAGELIKLMGVYMTDNEPFVRSAIAETLGVFGDKPDAAQLVDKLLTLLATEKSLVCQRASLNTLGQLQYIPALEQCIGLWQSSKDEAVAAAAIAAAGKISSRLAQTDSVRIELLVQSIADNISRTKDMPVLRVALFQAIRKILENEKWREITVGPFEAIITEALTDSQADVRAMAVYGYVAIRGNMAVSELLELGLLDDSEAAVRFAVISAIDKVSSSRFLPRLKDRFVLEQSADVKSRLQGAIGNILSGMNVKDVYNWLVSLIGDGEPVRLLRNQTTAILIEKVSALKALGNDVAPEYEIVILEFNFEDYLSKAQYEQAGRTLVDLLNYEMDDNSRISICRKLFAVIFDSNIDYEARCRLVDITYSAVSGNFLKFPEIVRDFEKQFAVASQVRAGDVVALATMLKKYIMPAEAVFDMRQAAIWSAHKRKIASRMAVLILSDELVPDQNVVTILKSLDPRFSNLPIESDVSVQKNYINNLFD